ncbi:hypothetical protein HDU79_010459 [Rhizoclosmatium sp. JEL0117]|nr:hypothetical protein HDU79_010459 [Rhizoclosmatium sp. JEL0117]
MEDFAAVLHSHGFDICEPFETQYYNLKKLPETLPPISTFSRPRTLSFLIGNSKHIWPILKAHARALPSVSEHPLDDYVHVIIPKLVEAHFTGIARKIQYTTSKDDDFIHFQLLAHITATSYYNKALSLCVHPKHGPWKAFRAVVTLDLPFPNLEPYAPIPLVDPYPECHELVSHYRNLFFESVKGYCTQCRDPSADPSHKDKCVLFRMGDGTLTGDEVRKWYSEKRDMTFIRTVSNHQYLIAARDAATWDAVKDQRYSDQQLRYHYSKDTSIFFELEE